MESNEKVYTCKKCRRVLEETSVPNQLVTFGYCPECYTNYILSDRQVDKPLILCFGCINDPGVGCARAADAKCLECGHYFCGYHIGRHLAGEHVISLTYVDKAIEAAE